MKLIDLYDMADCAYVSNERYIPLSDLISVLENGVMIEREEFIITPYYVSGGKRMELYEYEFHCSDEYNSFEDYILKKTGKERVEDVAEKIFQLRKMCFAKVNEFDKLGDYLTFLSENKELQEMVGKAFGDYKEECLYIAVY